jgi:serine/threonine protein kinase/tetratricopeptide (TPR) repeat protein
MQTRQAAERGESQFRPDQVISGRFKVVRLIGRGGMGEVYEARDLELHERVALKTIRPEIASDPKTLARFKQEIHLARRVTHPNVCRMYDLERYEPSEPSSNAPISFLTMELLEGETLSARLRHRGRMPPEEAISLIHQMAEGLAAAHRVGVIHLDFKPGNVILVLEEATGADSRSLSDQTTESLEQAIIARPPPQRALRVVITDFGLARAAEAADSTYDGSSSASLARQIIGTPAYMAPEQLEGRIVTPATDVYALGLVIYEMITGQEPFPGNPYDRLRALPPSPRALVPGLDPRWEHTILRSLEANPGQRFQTAGEVVQALSTGSSAGPVWAMHIPIGGTPPLTPSGEGGTPVGAAYVDASDRPAGQAEGKSRQGRRLVSRRSVIIAAVGTPLLCGAATMATLALKSVNTSIEVFDIENKTSQSDFDYFCQGTTAEVMRRLTHVEGVRVVPLHSFRSNAPKRTPSRFTLEGIFQAYQEDRGNARLLVSVTDNHDNGALVWSESFDLRTIGNPPRIDDPLEVQSQIAENTVAALQKHLVLGGLGVPEGSGRLVPFIARIRQTFGLPRARVSDAPTVSNDALDHYMRGRSLLGGISEASTLDAIREFQKAVSADRSFALAYAALAEANIARMNYHFATEPELLRNARTFAEQSVNLDPALAEGYAVLGVVRQTSWDWKGANESYLKALALKPSLARARRWYAGLILQFGPPRFEEAIQQATTALEQDPFDRMAVTSCSVVLYFAGRVHDAIKMLAPAVSGEMPGARYNLGEYYARLGYLSKGAQSEDYYGKAFAEARKVAEIEHRGAENSSSEMLPSLSDEMFSLFYSMKGEVHKAEPYFRRLLLKMAASRCSPVTVACVYALQSKTGTALDLLERAATWRDRGLLYIKVNPYFENLRQEPRFTRLVAAMGL